MKKILSLFALSLLTMSAWAANTYEKVTSLDQLEAGKKYIIVNETNARAMGDIAGTNTTYGSYVEITFDDDGLIDIEDTDVVELTAINSGTTAYGQTWAFAYEDGHLMFWTSGNSLTTISNESGASGLSGVKWVPTLNSDGVILKNNADVNRILQYNNAAPRFACYTSTQQPAVLYVQTEPESQDEEITTLAQANALGDNEYFAFKGNAVITVFVNGNLFLRDESGFGVIRGLEEGDFEVGHVLHPDWEAVTTSSNGWIWYYNPAGLMATDETNAELAAPIVLTGALDENYINAYVCYENAKLNNFPNRPFTLPDGTSIPVTDVVNPVNWPASGGLFPGGSSQNYNIYGVIVKVGDALRFNPLEFVKYVAPPAFIRGDVDNNGEVNITDAIKLINYLASGDDTGINLDAADCNVEGGDGDVNITDAIRLINFVSSGSWD